MPKATDNLTVKISELDRANTITENDIFPVNSYDGEGNPITKQTSINDIRQTIGFENAWLSTTTGLDATVNGDIFFVYETAAKLWVLQYQNLNGIAVPVMGYDNKQVRIPTVRQTRAVSVIADPTGYDVVGRIGSFDELRTTIPAYDGQRVLLKAYYTGGSEGGGEFVGKLATGTDDGGIVAAGSGFYWQRVVNGAKTPQMFGIKYDTTDTTVLGKIFSLGGRIEVPAGNYRLDCNKINLVSNTEIVFSPGAVVTLVNSSGLSGAASEAAIFRIVGTSAKPISNIKISGGQFNYTNDNIVIVSVGSYCSKIYLDNIQVTGARLLSTVDGSNVYANSTPATRSTNIQVSNCVGTAATVSTVGAFICFRYNEDSGTFKNRIINYYFGIQWWGGNGDPAADGVATNERKCKAMRFTDDYVIAVEAGIWGSMGYDIVVKGAHVEAVQSAGSDVGIDFEACVNSGAIGCYAKNFLNGSLATFFICVGIYFDSCVAETDNEPSRVCRINNSSQSTANRDISFTNCRFNGLGVVGLFGQNGAVDKVRVANCQFYNICLALVSNNNGTIHIENNDFYFNVVPTQIYNNYSVYAACYVANFHNAGRQAYLINNTFNTFVSWTGLGANCALMVLHTSGSNNTTAFIQGGGTQTTGWTNDIIIGNGGGTASLTLRFNIDNFVFYNKAWSTTLYGTATFYPQGFVNALDYIGNNFPTSPTQNVSYATCYYPRGQKFFVTTPAVSSSIGTIVTTAGLGSAAVAVSMGTIAAS